MSDFDPNKYLTTRVHGGVREIVGEEAEKIRARVKGRIMAWNSYDSENDYFRHQEEIRLLQQELILVKAERDGLASLLDDVRDDYRKERALVDGLTQAILDHIGASLEYSRD